MSSSLPYKLRWCVYNRHKVWLLRRNSGEAALYEAVRPLTEGIGIAQEVDLSMIVTERSGLGRGLEITEERLGYLHI